MRKNSKEYLSTKVYGAFTSREPCFIYGDDFKALNYGIYDSEKNHGGYRWVIISGRKASYDSVTPEGKFPKEVKFDKVEPYVEIINVTQVCAVSLNGINNLDLNLDLESLVGILKAKGMRFSG